MGALEARYAQALLTLQETPDAADWTDKYLAELAALIAGNDELKGFLLNPVAPAEARKTVVKECVAALQSGSVAGAATRASDAKANMLSDFLCLLIDKNRLNAVAGISFEYHGAKSRARNVLRVEVWSSEPLQSSQTELIKKKYGARYGASAVELICRVDAGLVGGIRVQIGDTRFDDTIAGRLSVLREALAIKRIA